MWNDGLVTEYLVDVSMDIYGKMDIGLILVGDVCKGGAPPLDGGGATLLYYTHNLYRRNLMKLQTTITETETGTIERSEYWRIIERDENGNEIYFKDSNGYWERREYDRAGRCIYFKNSLGDWKDYHYDENGNNTYFEDSTGYWIKLEYDKDGIVIYSEESDGEVWKA